MRTAALASLCALVCAVAVGGGSALASNPTPTQTTVSFKGEVCNAFTVPADVTSMSATATGSSGQGTGAGTGDEVSAGSFAVTPGETLYWCVDYGGGAGRTDAGAGGGASGVSLGDNFSEPLIVAGGGGGGGGPTGGGTGGDAGHPQGASGTQGATGAASSGPGTGGSQTGPGSGGSGGWASGGGGGGGEVTSTGPGTGGTSGEDYFEGGGGGGGAGYYGGGGGGGADSNTTYTGGGGGGGSDYCDSALVVGCTFTSGAGTLYGAVNNGGSAEVTLTYDTPVAFSTASSCSDWTVPAGVGAVDIEAVGAAGGGTGGGAGDGVTGSVAVTPGETLDRCADYGGGGGSFAGGGGASGVADGSTFAVPLLVAGGGGGGGYYPSSGIAGGAAGSPGGGAGNGTASYFDGGGGGGGTQNGPGGAGGSYMNEYNGGPGLEWSSSGPGSGGAGDGYGGGGGGGYYGGGGGGDGDVDGGGGGGGSDYCDAALVSGCAVVSGASATISPEVLIDYGLLQSISFSSTAPDDATVGGATYDVSATGGASGSPVTFSADASSAGVCTVSGSTVSFTGVGTCEVDANEAGGRGYDAAPQVSQSFAVGAAPGSSSGSTLSTQGCQLVTVPLGVTSVSADAVGAAGEQGSPSLPGMGDGVSGTFAVSPGEQLDVCVDFGGGTGVFGDGGGASGVSAGGNFLAPLIVAGGGGASGGLDGGAGGNAGDPQGAAGQAGPSGALNSGGGTGGSQTAVGGGGASGGTSGGASGASGPGIGGDAGYNGAAGGGGGGGAGYYGGGGGGTDGGSDGGGGGGGSDYCDSALVTGCAVASGAGTAFDAGAAAGDAKVTLTFQSANLVVFSGAGCQSWTVPGGVTRVAATAVGARGQDNSHGNGYGDGVSSLLPVTPGETLDVCVDVGGGPAGGGAATDGGAGGGASGVAAGSSFAAPLIVAGGGGGGITPTLDGGDAGEPAGIVGSAPLSGADGGGGGNDSAATGGAGGNGHDGGGGGGTGLATNASGPGHGGTGGTDKASSPGTAGGGGGGGGYYGGGGGGGGDSADSNAGDGPYAAAGGGGSDYCDVAVLGSCTYSAHEGAQTSAGFGQGDAQVDLSYLIGQTIAFSSSPPSGATVGGSYAVSASGGGSGNPVTFSIDGTSSAGACSVSGSTVSLTGAGTCRLDANQAAGNGYSAAAQVSQSFTIAPASPGGGGGGGAGTTKPSLVAPFASILGVAVNKHKHQAKLTFSATGSLTGEQCALVRVKHSKHHKQAQPSYSACSSPSVYKHLSAGSYVFYVRAVGPGGTQAPAASQGFKVK